MKILGKGAEAVILSDGEQVIKDRIKKGYRIQELDIRLRKMRTRREAKILEKLEAIRFTSPKLISTDDESRLNIELLSGVLLKEVLEEDAENYGKDIGKKIGILHNNNIIHHDLTTSNMIANGEIYFIDFGLSFFSDKCEDKAVDLHLLKKALESKHSGVHKKCFKAVLKGYRDSCIEAGKVIERLNKVMERGRHRKKQH